MDSKINEFFNCVITIEGDRMQSNHESSTRIYTFMNNNNNINCYILASRYNFNFLTEEDLINTIYEENINCKVIENISSENFKDILNIAIEKYDIQNEINPNDLDKNNVSLHGEVALYGEENAHSIFINYNQSIFSREQNEELWRMRNKISKDIFYNRRSKGQKYSNSPFDIYRDLNGKSMIKNM